MELLTDELRQHLPLIRKMHNLADEDRSMIYAKFFTARSGVTFYVAEGEQRSSNYLFWGLLIAPQFKFSSRFQIKLGRLQTNDWLGEEPCQRDENFKPTRWGAIERTVPNPRKRL
jgi:hypothetical protein